MDRTIEPVLITGHPRSGTTGLEIALNALQGVCIWHETGMYVPENSNPVHGILRRLEQIHRANDGAPTGKPMNYRNPLYGRMDASEIVEHIRRHGDGAPADEIISKATDLARTIKGALRMLGDKLPNDYNRNLVSVMRTYPTARVLFCVRDGRDVACSMHFKPKRNGPSLLGAAEGWARTMEGWERDAPKVDQDRLMVVRFEDGAQDPGGLFNALVSFLGMPDWPGDRGAFTQCYRPKHVGRWKDEAPDLMRRAPQSFKAALQRWGYV